MKVTLVRTHDLSRRVRSFMFKPEKPYSYIAGQFAELYIPHPDTDNRGDKRWFTLSSTPQESLLAITVDYYETDSSSFKQALWKLQLGQAAQLSEALGDFVAPKDRNTPLLFVAGGIGITPVRSIVKQLHDSQDSRPVHIWHSVHTPDDLYFENVFAGYTAHYYPIVQQPAQGWLGQTGRITPDTIVSLLESAGLQKIPKPLVYLSGPEAMAEALYEKLKKSGVPNYRLILDFFPGYTET